MDLIQGAIVPRYAPAELKGTAYGVYYLVERTALLVANSTVGALWQYASIPIAIIYSAVTSILAIVGMLLFLRRRT